MSKNRPVVYQLEHSPFCIPVIAIFKSLRVPVKIVNVSNASRAEIIKLTKGAYYQVPVLVDGKKVIYESSADSQDVARYIDKQFAGGRLFPKRLNGLQTIFLQYLENDVEGVTFKLTDAKLLPKISNMVDRVSIIRHKERKFGRGCVNEWRKDAAQLLELAKQRLLPFEQMLKHSPFLLGEEPVYSDFLLYGILGNLTYKNLNRLPPDMKSLHSWKTRMETFRFK